MTDDEFLEALGIAPPSAERPFHPLIEALRIDDLRSAYCEQLEARIAEQAAVIRLLERQLQLRKTPG